MSIDDLFNELSIEIENYVSDADKKEIEKKETVILVAGYLFDACNNSVCSSKDAIDYVCGMIINGHHYQGYVKFENIIKKYHKTKIDLEKSAEELMNIVNDYDKWIK